MQNTLHYTLRTCQNHIGTGCYLWWSLNQPTTCQATWHCLFIGVQSAKYPCCWPERTVLFLHYCITMSYSGMERLSWKHSVTLYEKDKGKATGLAIVPKLWTCTSHSIPKMRVDLAAQVSGDVVLYTYVRMHGSRYIQCMYVCTCM